MAREVILNPIGVAAADPRIAVPRADMSGPNAVEDIGAIGGEVIQGVQTGRAIKGVQEDVERFEAVSSAQEAGAQIDPDTGEIVGGNFDLAIQQRLQEVRAKGAQKFKEIALANEQRGIYAGSMMARLHTEKTVRDLAMQTPGFEDEIRRTAASVLGYDPMGFGMRQILDVAAPKQRPMTEWDKTLDRADNYMRQWNHTHDINGQIDMNEAVRRVSNLDLKAAQNKMYDELKREGQVTAEQVLTNYQGNKDDFLTKLTQRAVEGGIDVKEAANLQNLVQILKAEEYNQLVADAKRNPSTRLTEDLTSQFRKAIDDKWAIAETLVQNNTITKIATDRVAQFQALSQEHMAIVAPGLAMLSMGITNQAVAAKMADIMFSVGSEQQARTWLQNFPELRAILRDNEKPMESIDRAARELFGLAQRDGAPAGNPRETAAVKRALATTLYGKATSKEERSALINDLGNSAPDYQLALVSADPNSFNNLTPEARQSVAAQQATEARNLIRDIDQTINVGSFFEKNPSSDMRIEIDPETGKLIPYRRAGLGKTRDQWVRADEGIAGVKIPAIEAYNNIHRRLYANDQWRTFMLGDRVTSPAQASEMMLIGAQIDNLDRQIDKTLSQESDLLQSRAGRGTGLSDEDVAAFNLDLTSVRQRKQELEEMKDNLNARLIVKRGR